MLVAANLKTDNLEIISKYLPKVFAPEDVAKVLVASLSNSVNGMLIEYPYVDKDYRSTYYNFYAKKGLVYNSFCARLHFFKNSVELTDKLELTPYDEDEKSHYLGFMVLRPTEYNTIGRTAISPECMKEFQGYVMLTRHVTHILGYRFEVKAFPFMMQHADISVCAHVACWSILRYYSERFRRYAEFLTYDITRMATPDSPGGLIPSRGLVASQAIEILSKGGCYPDIYSKDPDAPDIFFRALYAYIESGFPVFAAMSKRHHAITVIGHGTITFTPASSTGGVRYSWDMIKSLVVADDNYFPYKTITSSSSPYSIEDIDAFIVPLPEKIYYSAEDVMAFTEEVISTGAIGQLDLSFIEQPIVRCFLTTSSSFRGYVRNNVATMPSDLSVPALELPLPQFIWVVEISNTEEWNSSKCSARFVLDATASKFEVLPFFLAYNLRGVLIYNRASTKELSYTTFEHASAPQPLFINNLLQFG